MTIYSRTLHSILLPISYGLRRRLYSQRRRFLDQSQWWSQEQLRHFQWAELQRLLVHVFETVPFYRNKYSAAGIAPGDIRSLEDFEKVPPLSRSEVNEHKAQLCSSACRSRLLPHSTGGSSGQPTHFYITRESYDWRCAASDRAYSWAGHSLGDRTLFLWGAPIGDVPTKKRLKEETYRLVRRELVIRTLSQTRELWQTTVLRIRRFRPRFVVGYTSSLEEFSRYVLETGARIEGIKAVLAAAEPVFDITRTLVNDALNAPLFSTYGSREFMSIAAECEQHDGMHLNMENLLVETELPCAHGPSELLVTDLHNYGMPFIRYRIGDVGVLGSKSCSCGRALSVLQSVEGRTVDMLRTRDGRVVTGLFFPHLLKDIREVEDFQVQQHTLYRITLSVVLSGPLSQTSALLIESEIRKVFGESTVVEVKPVETIARRPSGKRRLTIGLQERSAQMGR